MNILQMSLTQVMRRDELVSHLNRLRHPDGWFFNLMTHYRVVGDTTLVLIALDAGVPVGAMMVDVVGQIGVYVDKARRRQGIGTLLMRAAKKSWSPSMRCNWDDTVGQRFFVKLRREMDLIFTEVRPVEAAA